jgi:predicted glutamine amidotransferase
VTSVCRLLGVVADRPAPVTSLLGDDLQPFLDLACEHKDGWGLGHLGPDGLIRIDKGTERADGDDRLMQRLRRCHTTMAVLHLRMASPRFAVELGNTHPFGDGRAAFAHNGDISPAECLDPLIAPELLAGVKGGTDSERYYLAVRSRLDLGDTEEQAITTVTGQIRRRAGAVMSLNCLLLTPSGLFAYAEHDPGSEVMARRGSGFFGLSYRHGPDRTVIASQGWPQPRPHWQDVPEQKVLSVRTGPRTIRVQGG